VGCPSCELTRRIKKRDKAHVEVNKDLERIYKKALLRHQARKNKP
jgi:hypothetical protein